MSNCNRIHAINIISERKVEGPCEPKTANIDNYGIDVFNEAAMRKYLSKDVAEKLLATITKGTPIDQAIAGDVAHAMNIALERLAHKAASVISTLEMPPKEEFFDIRPLRKTP